MNKFTFAFLCLFPSLSFAQLQLKDMDVVKVPESQRPYTQEDIYIPDIDGYKTLKCDFHVHTIFSDGQVIPENRVWEGLIRGLDVMAITDHMEYRPHKYIKADNNEAYKIAKEVADKTNLILIPGGEITRSKPIGHINALFVKDANALNEDDPLKAVDNALKQGAFIMWNHPGWPNDTSTIYPVHKELIRQHKIHGVELVNGFEFYPKSFRFCKDYDLAYMGNTDIHGAYALTYRTDEHVGPMTLVFAKERSAEGVKEALFARRSMAKFGDVLIGPENLLLALVKACLPYEVLSQEKNVYKVKVTNNSAINYTLRFDNKIVKLLAGHSEQFVVKKNEKIIVENTYITDDKHLIIDLASL